MRKYQFVNRLRRKSLFEIASLVGGILVAALLPQAALAQPPSPLYPASDGAAEIARLYWLTFGIATVIFLLVEGFLLYTLFRFRQKDPNVIPPKVHGSTPLEIAWTIAPAIILFMVFVLMVRTMRASAEVPAEAMQIQVVGHQWWWEFQYPELGIETANELIVPAGRPVMVELTSDNVIHSFWIPQLAGKTDVVPGQTNSMWFQADEAGEYRGQCAELCGAQHANMNFLVIALPPDQFSEWSERQQQPALEASGEAAAGQEIFMTGQCIACHAIDGTIAQGVLGPNLTHFGSRRSIAGLTLENTPENLARWLTDPQMVKPLNKMVITQLSQEEVDALVQYLSNLH